MNFNLDILSRTTRDVKKKVGSYLVPVFRFLCANTESILVVFIVLIYGTGLLPRFNIETVIALVGLVLAIKTIRQNTEWQKMRLLHEMVQKAVELRKLLLAHKKSRNKNYKQTYLEYWEYLAFLINRKKIDAEEAMDLFNVEFQELISNLETHNSDEVEVKYPELTRLINERG